MSQEVRSKKCNLESSRIQNDPSGMTDHPRNQNRTNKPNKERLKRLKPISYDFKSHNSINLQAKNCKIFSILSKKQEVEKENSTC